MFFGWLSLPVAGSVVSSTLSYQPNLRASPPATTPDSDSPDSLTRHPASAPPSDCHRVPLAAPDSPCSLLPAHQQPVPTARIHAFLAHPAYVTTRKYRIFKLRINLPAAPPSCPPPCHALHAKQRQGFRPTAATIPESS